MTLGRDSPLSVVRASRASDAPPTTSLLPLLRAAADRVMAAHSGGSSDPSDVAEVAELVGVLVDVVHHFSANPNEVVDERLQSSLGRRVLDLLRGELIRAWAADHGGGPEALALLVALEGVRERIEAGWPQHFADRLSGADGLELLIGIAHDLRSPLTSILFLAETLQREQSGPINKVQRRQLGLIYGAALGLSSVASDVIELARGGDRLMETRPVPFSVSSVLESVRDIVRPIAEEKGLAVRLLAPKADYRLGHPVALSRVLLNLTTNALKFTTEGYVEIITEELGPATVQFGVRDSGRGIDLDKVGRALFQPLRQSLARGGQSFSQTGLGLAMCRKLVEAMGADLKVETRPGWGTRFYFELALPACPEPGAATRPERRKSRRRAGLRAEPPDVSAHARIKRRS